jgi:hypothetical protein
MVHRPNRSTPDYWFEKADQCFRRSRTDSNARVKLEALGNVFIVKAVELDITLQSPMAITPPFPPAWGRADDETHLSGSVDNEIRPRRSGAAVDDATRIPSPWVGCSKLIGATGRSTVLPQEHRQIAPCATFLPGVL